MRLTMADLVVLSVVLYTGRMHGYELVKRLDESDVADWAPVSRPQVYYSLRKLAAHGYLVGVEDTGAAAGPERTIYRPTPAARTAMRSELKARKWVEHRRPSPFVTWAALALHADTRTIDSQVERRREFLTAEIAREKVTLKRLSGLEGADIAVGRALVAMTIRQLQTELASLGHVHAALTGRADR